MNLKARRWQSGVFKGKKQMRGDGRALAVSICFSICWSSCPHTCAQHTNRGNRRRHTLLVLNSILWSSVSLGSSVRGPREEEWWFSGVRGKGRLGATASALGFSPWVARTWNILWDSLDLVHGKLAVSKRLHLCWRTSQPIPYSIQLNRERRNFSRGKMTFLNGSLVFVF